LYYYGNKVSTSEEEHYLLDAKSLSVNINNSTILKSLTFSVAKGEIYALLGGNGAGKSTTLKTFLGFNAASDGVVLVDGQDVSASVTQIRRKTAYLPENATLYPHLTARENVEYFLSLAEIQKSNNDIDEAFERVSLQNDAWDRQLHTFSKGMRQKTAIALALLRNAPIFLLDEPTSGLDPIAIDEFNKLVREIACAGATILMVTHDVYGACQVANRIGLLRNGELVGEFEAAENKRIDTESVHAAFAQRQIAEG
jgi:ABC-2 type transport system ATP-binding protein